ncbi:FMN-binding negative transcriptional regulator [Kitasatospora sp. NBC_01560]|uniref:FMN-binding negative transcriptional regulator n=1 Tax=Kitasatospora sp. NBC_01560 TaxID=2975965 RepID=UPI00386AC0D5
MFVPDLYRADGEAWPRRIMLDHPLATLTSNGEAAPFATHVPSLLPPGTPEDAPLAGLSLIGHMTRANPHWQALTDGTRARMMFDGPYGYVTPTVYRTDPAAPTWDFTSVHVQGRLRLVQDQEETLQIVRWTVETLEERFGDKWDAGTSLDYFRSILPGVGAFYLEIESVDAMFKLSQEKSAEVQERVIRRFEEDGGNSYGRLAQVMREFGLGETAGPASS